MARPDLTGIDVHREYLRYLAEIEACHEKRRNQERYKDAVEKKYEELGINYAPTIFGHDVYDKTYYFENCPDYLKKYIDEYVILRNEHRVENAKYRDSVEKDETAMVAVRHRMNKALLKIRHDIENRVRAEQGMRNIGEGWTNETLMFSIIKAILPEEVVEHHARPDWLCGLELDVFVPRKSLAFEYQGEQHFKPMEHWGGQEAFERQVERDEKKARLCEENNVHLIEIFYDQPVTEGFIRFLIGEIERKGAASQ